MTFVLGVVLPWILVGVGCWIGFQLIRQNGRILLRLDALEQQIAPVAALAAQHVQHGTAGAIPSIERLPVGSPAPEFELPTLSGKRLSLAQYRGKKTLLVFFSPTCGYCVQMAPDLAALPADGRDGTPIPLIITAGDRSENRRLVREHGIRAPVLLQKANEVAEAYRTSGTPMGYLVDEQGRIASDVAVGAQALLALARAPSSAGRGDTDSEHDNAVTASNGNGHKAYQGNRSLADSRIARDGLSAGTVAPDFRLPRVDGGELSLADYRGRRVLLVFSDPNCGPCESLAPKLEEVHRRDSGLAVVMITRGDHEENRRKTQRQGLTFPVVLQKQWEVSLAYAMFATPVAYLIDETGTLASDVAKGAEAILDLATRAPTSPSTQVKEAVQMA